MSRRYYPRRRTRGSLPWMATLIVLAVFAGVTGRAAMGPRLWMQPVWGTVTVVVGLIEVAIIWTIVTRCLPVCDMSALIRNILRHEPSTVIA
ncbi:MAG: hypothetical protein LKI26_01785 [Bifidobacterium tibiigranuli]|nr:hypothetical protein [Bifidobacterium tibiigranuli]